MKPRLALLTFDFPPEDGGVQRYLFEVAQRLAEYYQIFVVTPVAGKLSEPTHFERVILNSGDLWQICRRLRSVQPQIVVVGHAHPRLLLAALIAKGSYATIAHGTDFLAAQNRFHRPLFNFLLARSRTVIVNSRSTAACIKVLGVRNPSVIHPGVDAKRFCPRKLPDKASPVLLTVGRLVSRKGIDTVLHSLPQLLERFPDLTYCIGGEGPDRQRLEALTRKLGILDAVKFLGPVDEQALPDLYRQASIFVMPVREETGSLEGFGLVFLEASASGLPIIGGRSGGAAEAVRENVTGLLIEPYDTKSLVVHVTALLSDPQKSRQMGVEGRRWVENEMGWGRVAAQIVEALT